jgi:hypothetical protein
LKVLAPKFSAVLGPYSKKGRVWPSKEFSGTRELRLTLVEDHFLFNVHRYAEYRWFLNVEVPYLASGARGTYVPKRSRDRQATSQVKNRPPKGQKYLKKKNFFLTVHYFLILRPEGYSA